MSQKIKNLLKKDPVCIVVESSLFLMNDCELKGQIIAFFPNFFARLIFIGRYDYKECGYFRKNAYKSNMSRFKPQ